MAIALISAFYSVTVHDNMTRALWPRQLTITPARNSFAFAKLPLLEATQGDIFFEKHAERSVHMLEHVIAYENDCIEAFKNHADLWRRVPSIVATTREIRLVKSMSSTSAHGF